MKRSVCMLAGAAVLALVLSSCATGKAATGEKSTGNGSEFLAKDIMMVANADWGTATQLASFTPGVTEAGVECIEAAMPYGETAAVWHFSGLEPNAPVEFSMDVNIDCFMSDSFIDITLLPGIHSAEAGKWPRPWVEEHLAFKWIDSMGRFAGSDWPDATDGWETVRYTEAAADENGDFTVLVIVNHYTEKPPVVYNFFTNPEVRTLRAE